MLDAESLRDFRGWLQARNRNKHVHDTLFKVKSNILLLKRKPEYPVIWPRKIYNSDNLGPRKIYTLPTVNSAAKVRIKLQKRYKKKVWDPVLFPPSTPPPETSPQDEASQEEYNNAMNNDLQEFVSHVIKKSSPDKPVDEQNADVIKNLSLQLMDGVFNSMANPVPPIPSLVPEPVREIQVKYKSTKKQIQYKEDLWKSKAANKTVLDWEFMLSNVIQAKVPPIVVERVKRQMSLITGKKTPAITNMNLTTPPLSDLTMSDSELEMKQAIMQATNESEDNEYQTNEQDAAFVEDMKWLMNLTRKDEDTQKKVIEQIQLDYTNRILDLKPAFF